MKGHVTNIERDTLENEDYRRVIFTGPNLQLVLMTLQLAGPRQQTNQRIDRDGRDRLRRICTDKLLITLNRLGPRDIHCTTGTSS